MVAVLLLAAIFLGVAVCIYRLRPLWEELACALLCKCLTRSLCGIKMGRAVWVSRERRLVLSNVEVPGKLLDWLDLPYSCTKAHLRQVDVRLSWTNKERGAISIKVSGVAFTCATRQLPSPVGKDLLHKLQGKKDKWKRHAKLDAVEELLWGRQPRPSMKHRLCSAVARTVSSLLHDAQLLVEDMSIVMTPDQPKAPENKCSHPQSVGPGSIPNAVICHTRGLQLECRRPHNADEHIVQMGLKGFTICILGDPPGSSYEQDTTVVPRWSAVLHAKLQYREGGGLRAINVRLAANALQLCFTPQAMRTWLSLRANAMHYLQHRNYRRRRPQVPVVLQPSAWWQHATGAVLSERRDLLQQEAKPKLNAQEQWRVRQDYTAAYQKMQQAQQSAAHCLGLKAWSGLDLLKELEAQMSTAEVAECRWKAWAREKAGSKTLLQREEVLETLQKVLRLVDGQTAALSSTAPPAMHVNLTCPKVTVQLRSSPSPSRSFSVSRMQQSRGQGSSLICQLSLHELQLAEERVSRACRSPGLAGQSPKSWPQRVVKASIGRLHLSTAAEKGAAADVLQPKYREASCLATSPAATQANSDCQDFARLICVSSPVEGASFCKISLAPLDILSCKHSMLKVAAFVAEALPPPEHSPLHMKVHVSLREVIQDSLRGLPQHTPAASSAPSYEVKLGDINVVLPCTNSASLAQPAKVGALIVRLSECAIASAAGCAALTGNTSTYSARKGELYEADEESGSMAAPPSTQSLLQGGACVEAFFGEIDTGSGLVVEGKAPLIPQLTLFASLKQSIGRSNVGTYRRLLHLSFEASPLQLLLCNSAVEKLSALGFGLCHAAQDSSIAALISRRSQANLQEEAESQAPDPCLRRANSGADSVHPLQSLSSSSSSASATIPALRLAAGLAAQERSRPATMERSGPKLEVALLLNVAVERISVNIVHHEAAFLLKLMGVRTSLALDSSAKNIRFGVDSVSVEDLAKNSSCLVILKGVPRCVSEQHSRSRGMLSRAFQCWRHRAAQKSEGRLAAACHCSHIAPTADAQLHGHFSCTPGHVAATVKWSYLSAAVDVHMLQRAMQCARGFSKAWCAGQIRLGSRESMPPSPFSSQAETQTRAEFNFDVSCLHITAFVGTAPLLALVSEDLHAHQIRDTRCQPPLDRSLTCSKLRVLDAQRNKADYAELLSLGCNSEPESSSSLPAISIQQSICGRKDGGLEGELQIYCGDLKGIFLKRVICDCAYFCQLLRDEAKRCWPPRNVPKAPLDADSTESSCAVKVTFSGLHLSLPRHSWSPDMLTIASPIASMAIRQGAIQTALTKPEILWASSASADSGAGAGRITQRQIWHGGDLGVNVDTGCCQVRVSAPWAEAVYGAVQHELLMAILMENMYEPGRLRPPAEAPLAVGEHLPAPARQTGALGVDHSMAPKWRIAVDVPVIQVAVESLPAPASAPGQGPSLAEVLLSGLHVEVAGHSCGSLSIVVCSDALDIWDATKQASRGAPDARQPAVISIGQRQVRQGRLQHMDALQRAQSNEGSASSAQESAQASPTKLKRLSSLNWMAANQQAPAADNELHEGVAAEDDPQQGFYLEYVVQAGPAPEPDAAPLPGPHVLEIILKGASLHWPYLARMDFVMAIVEAYSHCFIRPWTAPNPPAAGPRQWMYINVILENSRVLVPLRVREAAPMRVLNRQHRERQKELQRQADPGLLLAWKTLRVGYFWGGDGERILRINVLSLSATPSAKGAQSRDLVLPFMASADVKWHQPLAQAADPAARRLTAMCQLGHVRMQPAFGHIPLLQALHQHFKAGIDTFKPETPLLLGPAGLESGSEQPRHTGYMRLDFKLGSACLALLDDRSDHCLEALAVTLQDVDMHFGSPGDGGSTFGHVRAALEFTFLNSAVDANEPLLERWPFSVAYQHEGAQLRLMFSSDACLNLVATPAAFRSIGDARSFLQALATPATSAAAPAAASAAAVTTSKVASLCSNYRLVNKSGLRLTYWSVSGSGQGSAYALNAWEESPLMVEPVQKPVILTDTQQQVLGRTLSMQFDGNWTAVEGVVVDKLGKYAYAIPGVGGAPPTPFILDVALDVRAKVLTVHSPIRLENHTSHPLSFVLHLASHRDGAHHAQESSESRVPCHGPLAPGSQCYLPLTALRGGKLYLQASGWRVAKKDRIDLDIVTLKDAQGLYTCSPLTEAGEPFSCCLEVKEDMQVTRQASLRSSADLAALPEYVLSFHPPLTIRNSIPYEITVTLSEGGTTSGSSGPGTYSVTIPAGGSIELQQYDLSQKIFMSMQLQDYRTQRWVPIHYPPGGLDDSLRRSALGDIPGLRLPKRVILSKGTASVGGSLKNAAARLTLCLNNKANSSMYAKDITIFCPFLIVNKTHLALRVIDTAPLAETPSIAPPLPDSNIAQPLLFSSSRGRMRLSLHLSHSYWSRSISLETIGMPNNAFLLAPAKSPIAALPSLQSRPIEGLQMLESTDPIRSAKIPKQGKEGDLTGASKEPGRSAKDPGHLLASLNCASAQAEEDGGSGLAMQRHDFALDSSVGPGVFSTSKMLTISSKYLLVNASGEPLQCAQQGTRSIWQLQPDCVAPFHWADSAERFELCVRPALGSWTWSGAFKINHEASFGARVLETVNGAHRILPLSVSVQGQRCRLVVGRSEHELPPYRIENRCEGLDVLFQQRDAARHDWEAVLPGQRTDYAWDQPSGSHKLCVCIKDGSAAFRDMTTHEYGLDTVKVHPTIKLRQVKGTVLSTAGRAISSLPQNMPANRLTAPLQSQQQAPRQDMRLVHVAVRAEGPTRVLCFSDSRGASLPRDEEETITRATAKLEGLQKHLQDLNGELKVLEERQGIELSALKSSSFRGISSREVMRTGSSIPELSNLVKRNALARRSSESRSTHLEPLDTIGEDELEALADEASAESQHSSRQMVGEETPAAYVHPAQEATAIEQADGTVLARPSMQHVRSSSSEALPAGHEALDSTDDAAEAPPRMQRQSSGNFLSRMSIYRSSSLHPEKARHDGSTRHPGAHPRQSMKPAAAGGRLSNTLRRASMMLPGAAQHERRVAFASSHASPEPAPKEELLGGELVVKIEDVTGLAMAQLEQLSSGSSSGSSPASASGAAGLLLGPDRSFARNLARHFAGRKGGLYCVLQCEGQTKHTAMVSGSRPAWKQELSFKSVQISSDLQITIYRKGHMGTDHFIGEIVVPLWEVEEVDGGLKEADIRRYMLGRRSAKDKVKGELNMACCWRVTPLDSVAIKARGLAAEVAQKEDMLALLAEQTLDCSSFLPLRGSSSAGNLQRLMGRKGLLNVKVIEARNLTFPGNNVGPFGAVDTYAGVFLETEAGVITARTPSERRHLTAPKWQHDLSFPDAMLSHSVTFAVSCHRRLSSSIIIGQATLSLSRLSHKRPEYLWLVLRKPHGDRALNSPEPCGELRVRLQWAPAPLRKANTVEGIGWSVELALRGVAISIVDAPKLQLPRELALIMLENVHWDFRRSSTGQAGRVAIQNLQIDNQLLTAAQPVILAKTFQGQPADIQSPTPMLEAHWETVHQHSSILFFKQAVLSLQEVDLSVEEVFANQLVTMVKGLPFGDIFQEVTGNSQPGSVIHQENSQRALKGALAAASGKEVVLEGRQGRRLFFEQLEVKGILCNLTLIPQTAPRDETAALGQLRLAAALGIQFVDISNLPLRINALTLRHIFVNPQTLLGHVTRHLTLQALQQMHKILGQVDIVGVPFTLGSSLVEGVTSLVVAPTQAKSPKEFFDSVGRGFFILFRNAAYGIMHALGQAAGGAARGCAALTSDVEYSNRFRALPMTHRQRMLHGVQSAGVGFYEGAIGIVKEPLVGWQDDSLRGLLHGIYIGVSGILLKPMSGCFSLVSELCTGASGKIKAWGEDSHRRPPIGRIRPPRQFSALSADMGGDLLQHSATLGRLRKGRYGGEPVLDYLENKATKAVYITAQHVVYVNLGRQSVRWALSLRHLFSVTTAGSNVVLHHELTVPVGRLHHSGKLKVHVPVRKIVHCRTHDLQQSLMCKLGRATQNFQATEGALLVRNVREESPFEVEDLHIIRRAPTALSRDRPESPEKAPPPAHMPGLRRLSQIFQPRSSSLEPPSTPAEDAASSASPASGQRAPVEKSNSMRAFRRGLQRLSGKPAAQHAEPQLQRDSAHDSSQAADSPGHIREAHSVQQNSQQSASLSPSTPPQDPPSAVAYRSSTGHASTSAAASSSRRPVSSINSIEQQNDSVGSGSEHIGNSSTEKVEREADRARMHPMLAAIQHLADEVERGDRQAAVQKLAAIRSICQAGLSEGVDQHSRVRTALLAIDSMLTGFEGDCCEEHAPPASQAAIIRAVCSRA